ncbi:LysR family transcriptional regulator [Tropicibacter sp. R15_0]|uniref:LysR family transcriptional regulator n=1 Tax=Tropicibacter sp. R15_0 TaxID=2821101 RepID=UPI001ADB3274|nr:LysR family transcriptional regulator [Tropicibacter sp. R15_0]MBO9464238.1 LysR family transcriptional regulator [Tropicibacter sp. R15_0]
MSLSPQRPKGPHLNSLRAFEAAARLKSFAAAADELSVTAGAVTQHVKTLEAWAGTRLFERTARGVKLTPLAEELLPQFAYAFDQLGAAVHNLRNKAQPERIRIAALPAIAQLWLAPRLGQLRHLAPEATVSIVAQELAPNLAREPFDLTLFYSEETPSAHDLVVSDDVIFPVCSPAIAERLNDITDLRAETLLHDGCWRHDWETWLKSQGHGKTMPISGTVHSLFSVALEEARHGGGVLIAHELLVRDYLNNGALVRPFAGSLSLPSKLLAKFTPAFRQSPVFEKMKSVLLEED